MALSDLLTALTPDQLKATMLAQLTALGFPVASWARGAVIRTLVSVYSSLVSPFTELQVLVARSGFLSTAEGPWLQLLAREIYDVEYVPATFATGEVTLTNAAGGEYTYAARTFRVYNPTTKKVYWNATAFTLSPLSTLTIAIEAVEVGAASTSAAGTVTALESTLIGVTVTNAAAVVGADDERDADLRSRCLAKLAALSPDGAALAYDYVCRTPTLNGDVPCDRTEVLDDSTTGDVTIYASTPSGSLSNPQIALLQAACDRLCVPRCIDATVVAATPITINIVGTVWIYANLNRTQAEIEAAVTTQLLAYLAEVRIGGHKVPPSFRGVPYDALEGEMRKAAPITTVSLTTPAGDVAMTTGQVARLGTVSLTVVQVT